MRWSGRTGVVAVGAAIALSVLLTATSGDYAPAAAAVVGPVIVLAGLAWLAWAVGWWSLPLMTVAVVIVGLIGSALFYDDQADVPPDLRVSGMDEIGRDPASVVVALPLIWIVLAVVVLIRRWSGKKTTRSTS